VAVIGDSRPAARSPGFALALLCSTLAAAAAMVGSSVVAPEGPSDVAITVPIGLALALMSTLAGLVTVKQSRSGNTRPWLRPGSLMVAQACATVVVVSMQHLGYLGAVGALAGGTAAAAALGVSWTYASDGEGVAVAWVSALAFWLALWFAGRADERVVEGLVAVGGLAGCSLSLQRFRRRWRSAS
jgi:hypothetical protein